METTDNHLLEKYNIVHIVINIFYITTLTFYIVIDDEIINRYYVLFLFIPIYINYYTTYLKDLVNISLFINFIYIFTKLIFMVTYFNYDDYHDKGNSYIIYSIVLYFLYIIEIVNMLYFYFKFYVHKNKYIEIVNS